MKKYVSLFLVLLAPVVLLGQKEYKSKEMTAYYKSKKYSSFKPKDKNVILRYHDKFFNYEEITKYIPFDESLYTTPYQDSINELRFEAYRDYVNDRTPHHYIGKIDRFQILKQGKKGNVRAFIYLSDELEDKAYCEPGIWVGYSENNGATWSYYFTGMLQKQPLFVKWNSSYPLINERGDLQIEACLLRQMMAFTPPETVPYDLVKDGLLLTIDMETLRKDSDGDGLTDIMEAKFRTNPNKVDTDSDGIPDNLDLNPRFAPKRTEKTAVFEAIINDEDGFVYSEDGAEVFIPFDKVSESHFVVDTTETIMIVTNDPSLQSVQPKSKRVIVLSEKEQEQSDRFLSYDLNGMHITPMFKVDGEQAAFLFNVSYEWVYDRCLAKKTAKGWKLVKLATEYDYD